MFLILSTSISLINVIFVIILISKFKYNEIRKFKVNSFYMNNDNESSNITLENYFISKYDYKLAYSNDYFKDLLSTYIKQEKKYYIKDILLSNNTCKNNMNKININVWQDNINQYYVCLNKNKTIITNLHDLNSTVFIRKKDDFYIYDYNLLGDNSLCFDYINSNEERNIEITRLDNNTLCSIDSNITVIDVIDKMKNSFREILFMIDLINNNITDSLLFGYLENNNTLHDDNTYSIKRLINEIDSYRNESLIADYYDQVINEFIDFISISRLSSSTNEKSHEYKMDLFSDINEYFSHNKTVLIDFYYFNSDSLKSFILKIENTTCNDIEQFYSNFSLSSTNIHYFECMSQLYFQIQNSLYQINTNVLKSIDEITLKLYYLNDDSYVLLVYFKSHYIKDFTTLVKILNSIILDLELVSNTNSLNFSNDFNQLIANNTNLAEIKNNNANFKNNTYIDNPFITSISKVNIYTDGIYNDIISYLAPAIEVNAILNINNTTAPIINDISKIIKNYLNNTSIIKVFEKESNKYIQEIFDYMLITNDTLLNEVKANILNNTKFILNNTVLNNSLNKEIYYYFNAKKANYFFDKFLDTRYNLIVNSNENIYSLNTLFNTLENISNLEKYAYVYLILSIALFFIFIMQMITQSFIIYIKSTKKDSDLIKFSSNNYNYFSNIIRSYSHNIIRNSYSLFNDNYENNQYKLIENSETHNIIENKFSNKFESLYALAISNTRGIRKLLYLFEMIIFLLSVVIIIYIKTLLDRTLNILVYQNSINNKYSYLTPFAYTNHSLYYDNTFSNRIFPSLYNFEFVVYNYLKYLNKHHIIYSFSLCIINCLLIILSFGIKNKVERNY